MHWRALEENEVNASLNVLVVEDESLVAMYIEDILDELGHNAVAVVGRMESALVQAEHADIDIAILDINLHGARTFPVAEKLAARGVPFVFATGYGAAGLEEAWADRPVLQKPFQLEEMRAAIATALR